MSENQETIRPEAEDETEDSYALNAVTVDAILAAVEVGGKDRLIELLEPLHEADIADLLEQIGERDRRKLLHLWGTELDGAVLSELEEGIRDETLKEIDEEVLQAAVSDMDSDDVVYLVEDLDEAKQERVLDALEDADRVAVEASLLHDEGSAGRLMQRELVSAPEHWTVGEAIDFMRASDDLPEDFYKVILIDPRMHPVATVRLGRIMANPRDRKLIDLKDEMLHVIRVDEPQKDVAYAFNQYHLVSAPVVDDDGRLIGIITIDDAVEVLEDEAEEDIQRLAGLSGEEEISDSILNTTVARFPWLAVNLLTAIAASVVIAQFAETIEAIVALAVLMPIVASMGGNAGTQSLTIAVRALATRDLTAANAMRVLRRESAAGLANGAAFAVVIGVAAGTWYGSVMLGVVMGFAMMVTMMVAGLAGVLIPLGLEKAKVDPALASGAFVTTVTDVVGFFVFLGLSGIVLL